MTDLTRCAVCGWPLGESEAGGCVKGNCSMRPVPKYLYDPERAEKENGIKSSRSPAGSITDEPENDTRTAEQISHDAIEMFIEYRDIHGYDEDRAKAAAVLENS